MSAIFQIN